jgi:hypothetical protein
MPPPADIDPDRLRELHARGLSCAAIAAELGVNRSTISRHARRLGLKFDRAQTRAATEAVILDGKAKRAQLANDLLDDATKIRAQLWERCRVYSFGGRDNGYNEMWHEQPDFAAQLKIMQTVSVAVEKVLRIEQHDADTQGLAAVDAWLRDMIGD